VFAAMKRNEITGKKALGPKWFVKPLPHLAAATFDAVRELVTRIDILTPFVHTPVGTPRSNKSRVALICNAISSGKNSYVIARRVRMVMISWLSLVTWSSGSVLNLIESCRHTRRF
jgi:hypothetical protein